MTTIAADKGSTNDSVKDFESFYSAQYRGTVVMVYGYTGDMAAAQDIAQEAFCRLWQRWQRVSHYDDPAAWVRRVSFHLAHSRWRRLKAAATYLMKQRLEEVAPLDPDHVAVVAALRKLPPAQREAIVLHHLMDLPVNEVAEYLEVPVGTVKSWLHRGRAALAIDLDIEARGDVVTPPAGQIVADARKRQRRRAIAATAAILAFVAGLLVVYQTTRSQRNPHPVTPSPSIMDSSIRSVGWPASGIYLDVPRPACPTGPTMFDTPNAWPKVSYTQDAGVAFGDLTGDAGEEAVLTVTCQESATSTPITGLLMVVRQTEDHALHVLGWPGTGRSDVWIDDGTLFADAAGRVNAWRWTGNGFSPVDASTRYPANEETDDAHWLILDRPNRPYLVAIQRSELVVLDRVDGGWRVVSSAPISGPGPARVLGRVADPSTYATGTKDLRLTVVAVSTPEGKQLFRWRNAQLAPVIAH